MPRRALGIADRHEGCARDRQERQRHLVRVGAEPGEHADRGQHSVPHLGIGLGAVRQLAIDADAKAAHVAGERSAIVGHAGAAS